MHESHTPGHKFNATAPQTWAYSVAPTRHDILCRLQAGALGVAMQSPPRGRRGFSADFPRILRGFYADFPRVPRGFYAGPPGRPRILRGFYAGANVQLYRVKLQKHTRGFYAEFTRMARAMLGPPADFTRVSRGPPADFPRVPRGPPADFPRLPRGFLAVPRVSSQVSVRWPRGIP